MTILAMLRHAETAWSLQGRIQGRTDIPLCDEGRFGLSGRTIPPEFAAMRVVTSPLARCVETAAVLGLVPEELEERIVEMSWGDWEGRRLSGLRAELGVAMAENEARGMDFRPPGGESPRIVYARVRGWLAEVASESRPTLAITHRGVMRVVFAAAMRWDMCGRPPARMKWGALQIFRLNPSGLPAVLCLNVPLAEKSGAPVGGVAR